MKKLLLLLLIATVPAVAFSQNTDNSPVYYSYNGKLNQCSYTWADFAKTRKELKPVNSGTEIKSFAIVTKYTSDNGESTFNESTCLGAAFSDEAIKKIEKLQGLNKSGKKISIEKVVVVQNGKEIKAPGMLITIQ